MHDQLIHRRKVFSSRRQKIKSKEREREKDQSIAQLRKKVETRGLNVIMENLQLLEKKFIQVLHINLHTFD